MSEAAPNSPVSQTGWLTIVWGDGPPGLNLRLEPVYTLTDEAGRSIQLLLNERLAQRELDWLALNGQWVRVGGRWEYGDGTHIAPEYLEVATLHLAPSAPTAAPTAVIGPQPWVSLLCKFSDLSAEPNALTYFQEMYADLHPGLNHYWREQSYDLVNVSGSQAAGWFTLPQPRAYYVPASGWANLYQLAKDCMDVADAAVDFSEFVGVNLMFNENLDCCAWGGARYDTRDGVSRVWRTTWNPPWAFQNVTVIAHEMGHGFGLPHSGGAGQEYNDPWDVMGAIWNFCNLATHPVYGCLAQHTIGYHKDRLLGWIPPEEKFLADWNTTTTLTLEQMALPKTNGYKLAQTVSCSTGHFYTVEARRQVGYDVKVPGNAVIIHEVYTGFGFPAQVMDADGNGNTGDAGAMWTVGETFSDPAAGVTITINSATATGFVISIANAPPTPCQPDAPYLLSPAYGSTQNTRTLNFTWEPPYAPNLTGYDFRLTTLPDPDAPALGGNIFIGAETTAYAHTLPADGNYYWFMRSHNTLGQVSAWVSNPFGIDSISPTVSFITPAANGYLTTNQPTIAGLADDIGSGVTFMQVFIGYEDGTEWAWRPGYEDDSPSANWGFVWDATQIPDQNNIAFNAVAFDVAYNFTTVYLWNVTLDRVKPTSAVAALPNESSSPVWVTWSGSDATSGVMSYTVQYKDGSGGAWTNWQVGVTNTTALFNGLVGHTYYFRSRASDRAGHLEAWPATADARTTINGLSSPTPTPTTTATPTSTPTSTPTPTPTATATPTASATATTAPPIIWRYFYLPFVQN